MPVRFTTPSLGGQGELQVTDLAAHQWRIALGYRHLHADQLFVGTQLLPTNKPLIINLHSVDVTTTYAVTDRWSLSLTVPFVYGMQYRVDQSIQPGDGGWGVILQLQAYRRAFHNGIAYLTGSYLVSLRSLSDVAKDPGGTV